VVLAAGYILWMIQRVFYGPVLEKFNGVKDAGKLEMVYMFIFAGLILAVGIYPAILTDVIQVGIAPVISLLGH
jgi:NADH-quinone oxidoreductase subunit M